MRPVCHNLRRYANKVFKGVATDGKGTHNLRRYANKVFKGVATDGKGTMGWCHGFKLHLLCNDRGEIITF